MEQRLHGDRVCVLSEFVFGPELKLVYTFTLPVHSIMYMILTVTLHVLLQIIADMQKKIRKLKKMLRQVLNTASSAQYPVLYQNPSSFTMLPLSPSLIPVSHDHPLPPSYCLLFSIPVSRFFPSFLGRSKPLKRNSRVANSFFLSRLAIYLFTYVVLLPRLCTCPFLISSFLPLSRPRCLCLSLCLSFFFSLALSLPSSLSLSLLSVGQAGKEGGC